MSLIKICNNYKPIYKLSYIIHKTCEYYVHMYVKVLLSNFVGFVRKCTQTIYTIVLIYILIYTYIDICMYSY